MDLEAALDTDAESERQPSPPLHERKCRKEMTRMTPQPDTGEVLVGLVERVTYHNAENGLRAKARGNG
jgi:hypothetical protein